MDTVHVHTDGSSLGNPGPAGWAVLNNSKLHSGQLDYATNNVAEMFAAIQGLITSPPNTHVIIHTDSRLVIGWLSMGWRQNLDYIRELTATFNDVAWKRNQTYEFVWVKGHSRSWENNWVDKEARQQARKASKLQHTNPSLPSHQTPAPSA